jgi:hypothetical protein
MRRLAFAASLALAGCNSGSPTPAPAPTVSSSALPSSAATPTAAASPAPQAAVPAGTPTAATSHDAGVLDSKDCRTVAAAYATAVEHNDFAFAARVWGGGAGIETRLKTAFANYAVPHFDITGVQEEGAAGSLYCTVTARLSDVANTNTVSQTGQIVLRRVNDVPGATAQQLRWTIQSSTFVEKPERPAK